MYSRTVNFSCLLCNVDNFLEVDFGCFVKWEPDIYCRVFKEVQGSPDVFIRELCCQKCGLVTLLESMSPKVQKGDTYYL